MYGQDVYVMLLYKYMEGRDLDFVWTETPTHFYIIQNCLQHGIRKPANECDVCIL